MAITYGSRVGVCGAEQVLKLCITGEMKWITIMLGLIWLLQKNSLPQWEWKSANRWGLYDMSGNHAWEWWKMGLWNYTSSYSNWSLMSGFGWISYVAWWHVESQCEGEKICPPHGTLVAIVWSSWFQMCKRVSCMRSWYFLSNIHIRFDVPPESSVVSRLKYHSRAKEYVSSVDVWHDSSTFNT